MHRCWNIAEIRGIIFDNIPPDTPWGSHALSQLAATCQHFSEPALDALWRKQTSFAPLLGCFGDRCSPIEENLLFNPFEVTGIILPKDWDRVLFYTSRIKFLDIPQAGNGLSWEVFELLSTSVPFKFLMPNLQHLSWNPGEVAWFPFIRLFLGPRITSIEITLDQKPSRLALLPFIAHKYRNRLMNFNIKLEHGEDDDFDEEPVLGALNAVIDSLLAIQTLYLQFFDGYSMPALARLPNLTSLTIAEVKHSLRWIDPSHGGFPALQELQLHHVARLSDVRFFLDLLKPDAKLMALGIIASSYNKESLLEILSSLEAHCSRTSLSSVIICGSDMPLHGATPAMTGPFLPQTLSPLLTFPNLTFVGLESHSGFNLDDDFVHRMAISWPQIVHLTLRRTKNNSQNPPNSTCTNPSIFSLQSLAKNCPRLEYLSLEFNASVLVDVPPAPPAKLSFSAALPCLPRPMQMSLETLNVGNSPILSSLATARFLCSMFASLKTITVTTADSLVMEHRREWERVSDLIPTIRAIRAEEESYWMSRADEEQ
ncbi:hypothetical protein R3P38DRAFT_2892103 [Favolaschia claudopus]|uniref:F-box domain-containing protein n=1 Tax=Favolaschia claudopus TaxID=2862362 RepID=A0AAW0CW88_9AGAR